MNDQKLDRERSHRFCKSKRCQFIGTLLASLILIFILHLLTASTAQSATIIYVDASATGAGTGANWTDAYTNLQAALAAVVSGDEIWVAAGVYYPDEGGGMTDDDPTATFTLIDGVKTYGGFAGGETSLTQRDWASHVTVLSGDIDQDTLLGGNSFYIVQLDLHTESCR